MGESIDFLSYMDQCMGLPQTDLRTYSPLTLAYIGDAVDELVVRTAIVKQENAPVQKLHKRTSTLVKASAQAAIADKIAPYLTEEEQDILRRGRNAKSYTRAKNASAGDYRHATGLEALMGYLYLQKKMDRVIDLIRIGLDGESLKRIEPHNAK